MKRILYVVVVAFVALYACSGTQFNEEKYLRDMRERMDQIQSASYIDEALAYTPGNPDPLYHEFLYQKEYKNVNDTTLGTSFLLFDDREASKLRSGYDGEARYTVYHEYKRIVRDDFTARDLPFRSISDPFFRLTYHIMDYVLNTHDSIEYSLTDSVDYYKFHLITHENEQIEFVGGSAKHIYGNSDYISDPTSEYEIWFSKQTNLPYRIKRTQDHSISDQTCHNLILNADNPADFDINDYLPQGYVMRPYTVRQRSAVDSNDLLNKPAPMWTTTDADGNNYSLKDIHAKVVLMEFSATNCGPCQVAVPFLKALREEYNENDLQIVSFESWGVKGNAIKFYIEKKGLNYPYLLGTDVMLKDYKTGGSAPWFFLLDQHHFVRKVFYGYGEGTTDKEIRDAIQEMIK